MIKLPSNAVTFLLVLSVIFGYILYKLKNKYDYWRRLNVPHASFTHDLLLFRKQNVNVALKELYEKLAPHSVGGIYVAAKPVLLARDPAVIRSILIKDFPSFVNRSGAFDLKLDPLRTNIFNLRDERWRNIRSKITPTFSSGKIRGMFGLLDECGKVLLEHLEQTSKTSAEIEVKGLMCKYTADVIGTCAFGLDCNIIKDENSEFRRMIALLAPKKYEVFIKTLLIAIHPKLMRWLRWKSDDTEVDEFFHNLTKDTIKNRIENEHKRNDFLQLLINVQHEERQLLESQSEKSEPLFPDHVLTAHVFLFFAAGYITSATTLSYCLYELALNPDVMDTLYKEIKETEQAHGEKLDYESIQGMRYLECVVSETLRKHPPGGSFDRSCNKPYQVPGSSLKLQKGLRVIIPVYALHHDPQYFPNPEKFDPERFNEENRSQIIPGTYLPFGDGPRSCIAMRFALVEVKSAVAKIIGNYTVHSSEKTEIPVKMDPNGFLAAPKTLYLKFKKR